jgi:thiol:disulfide interchange protein DsbD
MIGSTSSIFYCVLMLAALAGPPQRAKHLTLTPSASDAELPPGSKVTLTVELALDDNVHVYAPGAEGYLPVTWTIADSAAWKAAPVHLPASKILKLEAIGETAPVFDGTFRITREVTIGNRAAGDLTIEGSVRYQACDDRLCYRPETIPVKWTIRVKR